MKQVLKEIHQLHYIDDCDIIKFIVNNSKLDAPDEEPDEY